MSDTSLTVIDTRCLTPGGGNTFILSDMLPYALEPSLELVDHDGRFGGTYSVRLSVVPVSAWTLEDGASVVRIASMDTLFSGIDEWLENSIHLLKMSVILRTPLPTFASGTKCALFTNAYRDRFGWEMSDHAKAEQRSALSATGSFLDHVFDRSGYYASDDDGGAADGYNKCLCLCDTRPVLPTFNGSGAGSQQG